MIRKMIRRWIIKRRVKKMMDGIRSDWAVYVGPSSMPVLTRRISSTEQPGFVPSYRFGGMFEESDELFRERIKKDNNL